MYNIILLTVLQFLCGIKNSNSISFFASNHHGFIVFNLLDLEFLLKIENMLIENFSGIQFKCKF